jgi:hypothetical protein
MYMYLLRDDNYSEKNPPCLWWLQATFLKYIFHLLSSRLFMHFIMLYFVSFRCIERIFILFSLMGWPEYLFPTNFQIPLRIKLSSRKRYMYIVVQCGLSSIFEDGTTNSLHEYIYTYFGLFSIKNKRATCLTQTYFCS